MADYNLDEPDPAPMKKRVIKSEPQPESEVKKSIPSWNKWVYGLLAIAIVYGLTHVFLDVCRVDQRMQDYHDASDRLTNDMKPKASLMVKQLRTKAKQLERDPEAWKARHFLNSLLDEAKRYEKECDEADGDTSVEEVFGIAISNLNSFKKVYIESEDGITASIADVAEEFQDVADRMEAKLETIQ